MPNRTVRWQAIRVEGPYLVNEREVTTLAEGMSCGSFE